MKKVLIALIFVFLFLGFFHPITSMLQDLGRHLLVGEIIVTTLTVPKTNLLSYTHPDFPFINHHWLSEVFYFFIVQSIGFNGVLILSIGTVLLAFSLIFFYSLKRYRFIPVLLVSLLLIRILFERTDIRPEVFSFLFVSLFVTILYRYREGFTRLIFILPLIELFWVNVHIYFPIGIALLGLFLIDLIAKYRKKLYSRYIGIFVVIIFFSCITTLFNPNGVDGALYPFSVFQNYGYTIEENQTVFFLWNYAKKQTIIYFWISISLLIVSLLLTIKKSRPIDWFMTLFFGFLAVQAIRNFPLFVFGAFIPFVHSLTTLSIFGVSFLRKKVNISPFRIATALALTLFIVWQIQIIVSSKTLGFGVEKGAENSMDFFEQNNLKGPIFNNFDIGSYIAYRLYPKEKVFVDGRPEAYPAEFFREIYKSMQLNHDVFKTHEKKYKFNTIVFSHTDQTEWGIIFLKNIVNDPSWQIVYLDDFVIILVKNTDKNSEIIKRFAFNEKSFQNGLDHLDIKSLYRYVSFFQKVGWQKAEMKALQKILAKDPNSCIALYHLARITLQNSDPSFVVYSNQYNTICR